MAEKKYSPGFYITQVDRGFIVRDRDPLDTNYLVHSGMYAFNTLDEALEFLRERLAPSSQSENK